MIEKLAKAAEKCAKNATNNQSCPLMIFLHQPKMPKSLIKKDEEK